MPPTAIAACISRNGRAWPGRKLGISKSDHAFSHLLEVGWLAQADILALTNFVSEWALTVLGISLILGIFVRLSSVCGVILMMLFYFPTLTFPHAGEHSYIVDEHIIYALVLIFFAIIRAGRTWGLDAKLIEKYPTFPRWLS